MDLLKTYFESFGQLWSLIFDYSWLLILGIVVILIQSFLTSSSKRKQRKGRKTAGAAAAPAFQQPEERKLAKKASALAATEVTKAEEDVSKHEYPSNRFFESSELRAKHQLASGQCEYTDIRTRERCKNRSAEGDHFYPFSKGGATTLINCVSACKFHNQRKKAEIWLHEKRKIEERRKSYYPTSEDVSVGEWQSPLRLTVVYGEKAFVISSNSDVSLEGAALELPVLNGADRFALQKARNPADVFDFFWTDQKFFVKSLEGIDPITQSWVGLRSEHNS